MKWQWLFVPSALAAMLSGSVSANDDLYRAGCPQEISRLARPGYGSKYVCYYVGGGAGSRRGEPRRCDEGTFGVDYRPIVPGFRTGNVLAWWHGRRYQGGPGQYEPNERVSPLPNWARPHLELD